MHGTARLGGIARQAGAGQARRDRPVGSLHLRGETRQTRIAVGRVKPAAFLPTLRMREPRNPPGKGAGDHQTVRGVIIAHEDD